MLTASLGISILLLSACSGSDENPMLKPQMMRDLGKSFTWVNSMEELVTCVKYGADPDEFESKKALCSKWMSEQYKNYASKTKFEMDMVKAAGVTVDESGAKYDKAVPTYEEFSDPEVWKTLWKQNGKKWSNALAKHSND